MVLRNLSVDYPEHPQVLGPVSLTLDEGSYTLIAGPTGSGKSTLALTLVGAIAAATKATVHGECSIRGIDVTDADPRELSSLVAAVWQRPSVQLFRPTVIDEVRSGLDHRCVPAAEVDARARAALATVGLDHLAEDRDPVSLSSGEQQRLALAAALVLDAPVLVLDEATSALDRAASVQFGQAIARARAERTLTVVAIDHRVLTHRDQADRLLVLDRGTVVHDGDPRTLMAERQDALRALGVRLDPTAGVAAPAAGAAAPTTVTPAALALDDVDLALGGSAIVSALSLHAPRGAVVLVTGDNGTGKSTILRLLADEIRPARGTVAPRRRARIRAGIGDAPARAADLMLTRTVRDELASALQHTGTAGSDAVLDDTLRVAGLDQLAGVHPLRLSGGQRQRLAVALAIVGRPALALLDEPTSAQDRIGLEQVVALTAAGADERVTLIATHEPEAFASIATHRLSLARNTAPRVVTL